MADLDSFNISLNQRNFIRSEVDNIEGLGKTLILTQEEIGRGDDPSFYAAVKYYFGIVHGKLVFLGDDTIERSMPDDGMKLISGGRAQRRLAYAQFDGYVLPKLWTHSIVREKFDAEMKPVGVPYLIRDVKFKVVSCQILKEFPMNVLDISIPASAKLIESGKRPKREIKDK